MGDALNIACGEEASSFSGVGPTADGHGEDDTAVAAGAAGPGAGRVQSCFIGVPVQVTKEASVMHLGRRSGNELAALGVMTDRAFSRKDDGEVGTYF